MPQPPVKSCFQAPCLWIFKALEYCTPPSMKWEKTPVVRSPCDCIYLFFCNKQSNKVVNLISTGPKGGQVAPIFLFAAWDSPTHYRPHPGIHFGSLQPPDLDFFLSIFFYGGFWHPDPPSTNPKKSPKGGSTFASFG